MSCQHHGEADAELEASRRFISEMLGKAEPRFPQGKLNEHDGGEISFAVAVDLKKEVIILRCTKPVDWLGLDVKASRHLANLLWEKADQLETALKEKAIKP